jgi:cytochrome c-type biogenesis protein CcmE
VPVRYTGIVPDPFAVGRGVAVTVTKQGSEFIGQRDSLLTKCPSKYQAASASY